MVCTYQVISVRIIAHFLPAAPPEPLPKGADRPLHQEKITCIVQYLKGIEIIEVDPVHILVKTDARRLGAHGQHGRKFLGRFQPAKTGIGSAMLAAEIFRLSPPALSKAFPGFRTPEEALATVAPNAGEFDVDLDDDRVIPLDRFEPTWLGMLAELALPAAVSATTLGEPELVRVVDLEGGPWVVALEGALVTALAGLDDRRLEALGGRLADAVKADLATLADEEFRNFRLQDHSKEPFVELVQALAAVSEEAVAAKEGVYVLYGEADDGDAE